MIRQDWRRLPVLFAMALAVGTAGCLITYDPDAVELAEPVDTSPRLFVLSPQPDQRVGDDLQVRLEVRNFNLVPKWGQANVEGEGHLFVLIDGTSVTPTEEGVVATDFSVDVRALAGDGETRHTLEVQVRNNDRTRFEGIRPIVVEWIKLPAGG